MAIPGTRGGQYTADGLTHTERGIPTSGETDHNAQLDKRRDKIERFTFGDHWATIEGTGDLAVLTWGSLTGTVREAIERVAADGIEASLLALRLLSPAQPERFAAALAGKKRILVVEQSHGAQFHRYLRAHYDLPGGGAGAQPSGTAANPGRRDRARDIGMEVVMSNIDVRRVHKPADYKSDIKPIWCPGCGDYHVLMSFTRAFAELDLSPEQIVVVSGIGCSSRIPAYTNCYGFHGVHGRSLALAAGLKVTRPDLTVVVASGDGDGYSIGGNHFLHACRRNIDMTYVVMDNRVYGMTKGQPSPTTEPDFDTALSPGGHRPAAVSSARHRTRIGGQFHRPLLLRRAERDRVDPGRGDPTSRIFVHRNIEPLRDLSSRREGVEVARASRTGGRHERPRQGRPPHHDRRRLQYRRSLSRRSQALPTPHRAREHRPFGTGKGLRAMSKASDAPKVTSLADLFAVAYRIEADAVERYDLLADQMETHNNPELMAVFRDLARAEGIHRDEIRRLAGEIDVVAHAQRMAKWSRGDSPEEAELGEVSYLMTPWHALKLALAGEERALAYFQSVVASTKDPKIKKMAEEFVEEEAEHVNLVHRLLRKYPQPSESWAQDPDPPAAQE